MLTVPRQVLAEPQALNGPLDARPGASERVAERQDVVAARMNLDHPSFQRPKLLFQRFDSLIAPMRSARRRPLSHAAVVRRYEGVWCQQAVRRAQYEPGFPTPLGIIAATAKQGRAVQILRRPCLRRLRLHAPYQHDVRRPFAGRRDRSRRARDRLSSAPCLVSCLGRSLKGNRPWPNSTTGGVEAGSPPRDGVRIPRRVGPERSVLTSAGNEGPADDRLDLVERQDDPSDGRRLQMTGEGGQPVHCRGTEGTAAPTVEPLET